MSRSTGLFRQGPAHDDAIRRRSPLMQARRAHTRCLTDALLVAPRRASCARPSQTSSGRELSQIVCLQGCFEVLNRHSAAKLSSWSNPSHLTKARACFCTSVFAFGPGQGAALLRYTLLKPRPQRACPQKGRLSKFAAGRCAGVAVSCWRSVGGAGRQGTYSPFVTSWSW